MKLIYNSMEEYSADDDVKPTINVENLFVDINMTEVDTIAHKLYHLIERGPDCELLTAIGEGLCN